jgi:hypothetical protein
VRLRRCGEAGDVSEREGGFDHEDLTAMMDGDTHGHRR